MTIYDFEFGPKEFEMQIEFKIHDSPIIKY